MTRNHLSDLCQRYWTASDDAQRRREVSAVVAATANEPPDDAVTTGRCLTIIDSVELPSQWQERVAPLRDRLPILLERHRQLDTIGDTGTEPEAIFDLLGDEIADGLDMNTFDAETLRRARLGKPNRVSAAEAFLTAFGWHNLSPVAERELHEAAAELAHRADRWQSTALFVRGDIGVALGVQVTPTGTGQVNLYSQADAAMRNQAVSVLTTYAAGSADVDLEWPVQFGGDSIGLSLVLAARELNLRSDPLLAATGRIDASGRVCHVGGVAAKVRAAHLSGYRRLLVPIDDLVEATAAISSDLAPRIDGVEKVADIDRILNTPTETGLRLEGALRIIRRTLPLYGLDLADDRAIENAHRLVVADASSVAQVDVFSGRRATVRPTGKGSALQALERLISERLPRMLIEQRGHWTVQLKAADRREKFARELREAGAAEVPLTSPYEEFRLKLTEGASSALAVGYTSGKIHVPSGQAPAHDRVTGLLADAAAGLAGLPPRPSTTSRAATKLAGTAAPSVQGELIATDEMVPHIGTDEAGKGDYFGPLVCAACYLDTDVAKTLRQLGVRDSKKLSDKTIRVLAEQIRSHLPGRFSVVTIRPARYNRLYSEMRGEGKNLNSLVAWGHARGIKDLFEHGVRAEYAVIDKFADERYLHERLDDDKRMGNMRLEHRTKAEADVAVAAASILARDAFVRWFDEASRAAGQELPKGAGPQVIEAGQSLVRKHGPGVLQDYAKISFKTTRSVLDGAS